MTSTYLYDALGRRVGQTASGLTTQYIYDMLNVAQEQYTGGTVADMLAGLGLDQNFARTDTSGSYAMLPDLLGSTIAMVNSAEAITTAYQYGPVGRTTMTGTSSTAPSPARHGDCVKEQSSRRAALSRWARERAL